MSTRGRYNLTEEDFVVAGIGGTGLFLMILGGLLLGFGTVESDTTQLLVMAGLLLLLLAVALWLFWRRPWTEFDDLQTPHYTGHHDDHAADHAAPAATADAAATPAKSEASAPTPATKVEEPEPEAKSETPEPVAAAEEEAAEEVEEAEEPEPEPEPEAAAPEASGEPDDLRKIEGIGPKTQEALYADGIQTYAQLAALTPDEIEHIVKEKHSVRIRSGAAQTWPKQARFLTDGDLEGLAAYQDTLVGGREVDD